MKEFYFRRYLRRPMNTFISCFVYIISFFLIYGVVNYMTLNRVNKIDFNKVYWPFVELFIGIISAIYFFVYIIYFRKLKNIKITLDEDKIVYKCKKVEKIIHFDEIEAVDFAPIKYNRGWIRIKSKITTIKLSVDIQDIAVFLKEFKERLDQLKMSDKYNSKKMYDFYKTASYSDDSWERIYELLKFVPPVTGLDVVLGFIFSFFVDDIYVRLVIIVLLFLFPLLVLIFTEIILVVKHIFEMSNEQYIIRMRDYQYEHRVFDAVTVILGIMIGTILIYLAIKY